MQITMNRTLFLLSYGALHLSPVYVLAAAVAGTYGVDGWLVLLPMMFGFVPASIYLITRRCSNCGSPIYTVDHMKKAPGGINRIPIYRWRNCPECGHPLSADVGGQS